MSRASDLYELAMRNPGRPPTKAAVCFRPLGRLLTCVNCGERWDVIEASSPNLGPHQWVDPATYICPGCNGWKKP